MKKKYYLDDELALEANLFLTSILYERIGASNVKWNILGERVWYLKRLLE